jgi:hypothetical protein
VASSLRELVRIRTPLSTLFCSSVGKPQHSVPYKAQLLQVHIDNVRLYKYAVSLEILNRMQLILKSYCAVATHRRGAPDRYQGKGPCEARLK